jgi:diguanylate cyclase (GGDEF)-like protein
MNAAPPPAQPLVLEARMQRRDGSWCTGETTVSNLLSDEGVRGILLTTRDISERKILEEQLRHRAFHDPLTSLGNRTLFRDRVEHAVVRSARSPQELAVMVIDLDGFKGVNDSLGHAAGDRLLKEVASRLRASVRPGDTVSRMGGDEFAILLEGTTEADAITVAQRIINRLRAPIEIEGKEIVAQGSVGISVGSTAEVGAEELQRSADLAMYVAKSKGKGRYAVFEPSMHKQAKAKVELESDLRRGLRERELVLHYQPIVELPTGRISGAEALVRWNHPERGMVPPMEFIPVAEESDLVVELGRYVLQDACREAKRFQAQYPTEPGFTISVNVAARQLTSPWLVREVERALEDSGIEPSTLVLEITEGALMGDTNAIIPTLHALKDLGVQLAIDDFGTGWSSLSRLRSFPVDKVKIDRSFVSEIMAAGEDAPIVAATIAMAHSLHLKVVAEGVETAEQLACLHHLECEEVQGYLLARPMPAAALDELLLEPGGLLEGASAMEPGLLTASERELMGVVADAVQDADGVGDLVRPVLSELHRVAGVDAVYLTEILWEDLTQRVAYAVDTPDLRVPEGALWPWPDSPCAEMLGGGSKLRRDVPQAFAGHPVCDRIGATAIVTVPVKTPDGKVFGTLCAVSATPGQLKDSTVVLFDLFARLLVEHVNRQAEALVS